MKYLGSSSEMVAKACTIMNAQTYIEYMSMNECHMHRFIFQRPILNEANAFLIDTFILYSCKLKAKSGLHGNEPLRLIYTLSDFALSLQV